MKRIPGFGANGPSTRLGQMGELGPFPRALGWKRFARFTHIRTGDYGPKV